MRNVAIKEAVNFHGHLGPYLILGILAGEAALKRLRCKKYFDIDVKVYGVNKKPKSCLIDGLQLSTGATYGKGNIRRVDGNRIQIILRDKKTNKKIEVSLRENLIKKLDTLKGHRDSEAFARKLFRADPFTVFNLTTDNC